VNPSVNGDYEEALRRALHAAADSIEPAGDGLQRIRERLSRPMLSFETATAWYAGLAARVRAVFWAVVDRFRPVAAKPGHARPALGWLRPVAAMGVAIFVVAAGVFALTGLPQVGSFSGADSTSGAGHNGSSPNGATGGGTAGSGLVSGASSASTGGTRHASPAASACAQLGTSRTGPASAPASSGTSGGPSGTASGTAAPSTDPSPSIDPSPSTSGSGAPGPGSTATSSVAQAGNAMPASTGSPCPSKTPARHVSSPRTGAPSSPPATGAGSSTPATSQSGTQPSTGTQS
jgi:hypothetical protein